MVTTLTLLPLEGGPVLLPDVLDAVDRGLPRVLPRLPPHHLIRVRVRVGVHGTYILIPSLGAQNLDSFLQTLANCRTCQIMVHFSNAGLARAKLRIHYSLYEFIIIKHFFEIEIAPS